MDDLKKIVANVLGQDKKDIDDNFSREINAADWDSLKHLVLISEVEKVMEVHFSMQEVGEINSFKKLRELVSKHRGTN